MRAGLPQDPAEVPAYLRCRLNDWLAQHMRWVKLPELLIEVNNELGFTRHLMTPLQQQSSSVDDICTVLAAVMAFS